MILSNSAFWCKFDQIWTTIGKLSQSEYDSYTKTFYWCHNFEYLNMLYDAIKPDCNDIQPLHLYLDYGFEIFKCLYLKSLVCNHRFRSKLHPNTCFYKIQDLSSQMYSSPPLLFPFSDMCLLLFLFLFVVNAFLHISPFLKKETTVKGKNCSKRSKFFPFRVVHFSAGRQSQLDRVARPIRKVF